jgi:hypothetical protein
MMRSAVNDKALSDELYVQSYELAQLADLVLRMRTERWVPGYHHPRIEYEHLDRYRWACRYVQVKSVPDVSCGCGYGSYLVAIEGNANQVTGLDID